MPAADRDWAQGYARQALSDLGAREILAHAESDKCHRLHFLQMATEKVCKAHLIFENGRGNIKYTHAYIARNLPIIARHFYAQTHDRSQIPHWEISEICRLAREIELLAPACDGGDNRQDNSEYPWEDGKGNVRIPCEYNFPNIDDGSRAMVRLIRLIQAAAEMYAQ